MNRFLPIVVVLALACHGRPSEAAPGKQAEVIDPTAKDYRPPPLPHTQVTLTDAFGGKHPLDVELCLTDEMRARGMMWRTEFPAGKGMLFVFPDEEFRSFWMKNTLIPLDIIFIGADLRVVGVVENAAPKTLTSRSVEGESKYVLEVPGGWSAKVGLKAGSKVEIANAARFVAE